jgi:O-antigen polymerase
MTSRSHTGRALADNPPRTPAWIILPQITVTIMRDLQKSGSSLLLCILLLCGTLVNTDVFGPPTLSAYFLYVLFACLLCLTQCLYLFRSGGSTVFVPSRPVVLFLSFIGFYFLRALLMQDALVHSQVIYLGVHGLFLTSLCYAFSRGLLSIGLLYSSVFWIATAEAVFCWLQFVGLAPSLHSYFRVTGTWINPNVPAMFLALSLPAAITIMGEATGGKKKLAIAGLALICSALLLLQCRTALVGAFAGSAFLLQARYGMFSQVLKRLSFVRRSALLLLAAALLSAAAFYLYQSKKQSAEGRLLIWKVSLDMVQERPWTGYGTECLSMHITSVRQSTSRQARLQKRKRKTQDLYEWRIMNTWKMR